MDTGKISRLGILLALSIILSYLESLLPIAVSVPGIKLGLANTVTMVALYIYSEKEAGVILVLRVIMTGFMFSGINSIIFGLVGGCLCIIVMSLLKKFSVFSVMGISMSGAVSHNIGQIIAAFIVMNNSNVIYYLPYLLIAGSISGILIGYISVFVIKMMQNI